jgi:two-component system, OmpR family, alkaline phosphatase synthesis response regulator PhoP
LSDPTPAEPKKEILVAEDEEHIAKLVHFKLTREGFQVTIAKNGQEAIDLLKARPWALVILDIMMPIADGWTVLKSLRAMPELSHLPVLMLTAKGYQKDAANAAELGAQHFLKKPFDPSELAALVKKMSSGGLAS